MKKVLLVSIGILCAVLTFGQTNFQKLTLDEACARAKADKKLVFVDLYTSWCAPCKIMADKVFPDAKLGKFMNERFVCVKYDTGADKDGAELAKKFNVQAYPTFLILNTDKGLENQIIGATLDIQEFIGQVEEAMKASIANMERQYASGDRSVPFLTNYLKALLRASMSSKAQEVCASLLDVLPAQEKSNRDYWFIFSDQMLSPAGSPSMDYLFSHFDQFTRSLGEEKVLNRISEALDIKLRDIIRGREIEDLDKVTEQMKPHHFNSRSRMDVYVALARAMRDAWADAENKEKIEKVLVLCETEFPKIDGKDLVWFYFPVTMFVSNTGTEIQRERVRKLHRYIYEHTDYNRLRAALGNMIMGSKKQKKN